MAIKLEVFSFYVTSYLDLDLYASTKFCVFNTNLNNCARFRHHFPVL